MSEEGYWQFNPTAFPLTPLPYFRSQLFIDKVNIFLWNYSFLEFKWNSPKEEEPEVAAPEPEEEPEPAKAASPSKHTTVVDDDDDKEEESKADDAAADGDEDGDKGGDAEEEGNDEGCGTDRPYCVADLLHLNEDNHEARRRKEILIGEALGRLHQIVNTQVHPLEKMYKYEHLAMSSFGGNWQIYRRGKRKGNAKEKIKQLFITKKLLLSFNSKSDVNVVFT